MHSGTCNCGALSLSMLLPLSLSLYLSFLHSHTQSSAVNTFHMQQFSRSLRRLFVCFVELRAADVAADAAHTGAKPVAPTPTHRHMLHGSWLSLALSLSFSLSLGSRKRHKEMAKCSASIRLATVTEPVCVCMRVCLYVCVWMTLRHSLGQRQLSANGSRCETFAGVTCRAIEIGGVFHRPAPASTSAPASSSTSHSRICFRVCVCVCVSDTVCVWVGLPISELHSCNSPVYVCARVYVRVCVCVPAPCCTCVRGTPLPPSQFKFIENTLQQIYPSPSRRTFTQGKLNPETENKIHIEKQNP